MTYEQFHQGLTIYCRENPAQRYGQAVFNYLWEVRALLAEGLKEAGLDPFYADDGEVYESFLWLKDNWGREEYKA